MTARAANIKNYLTDLFAPEDDVLSKIRARSKEAGLPAIEVPATVGKLLYCLAKIQKTQRILEIGTLAGYSTLWLARALSKTGKLISLELDKLHAVIARENLQYAGVSDQVEVREGKAQELLDHMIAQKETPFDLIFIDADKESYPIYLEKALQLSHEGTLILSDNLLPRGDDFGNTQSEYIDHKNIYQFNEMIAAHLHLESILATTIVGDSGRIDALGISIVKSI
jgi:predicted O-methyltransferase YrrM